MARLTIYGERVWLPGDIANSGFGVQLLALGPAGALELCIRWIPREYFVTQSAAPGAHPGGGGRSVATTNEWGYSRTLASDGEYTGKVVPESFIAGASAGRDGVYKGNIYGAKAYVGVGVVASADPQVTGIYVFRTKDGGSTFYALPMPNTMDREYHGHNVRTRIRIPRSNCWNWPI